MRQGVITVLVVTQKDHNLDNLTDPSPSLWGSVNSLTTAPGNLLPPGLSSVRTVLHFGSARSSIPTTGEKKVSKATLQSAGLLTPVNPRCVLYVYVNSVMCMEGERISIFPQYY